MAGGDEHARRATSFGAHAAQYERGRPGYPAAALRHCLPADARRVLDLAAGTGKLTTGLLALGLDVVAVEPLDAMRALIPPQATALAGAAEAIPLADATVDAVLVGQAFHWFDRTPALAEIARVLRPGGTLGLLWNAIEPDPCWAPELAAIVVDEMRVAPPEQPYEAAPGLTDPVCCTFAHAEETDGDRLADNLGSRSGVILLPAAEREALLARVRELAPGGRFALPMRCVVWRGERRQARRATQISS